VQFQFIQRLWRHAEEDDIAGLAAELACRSFLELFPFFVFLAAIGAATAAALNLQNPIHQALQLLSDSLPSETADPIRQQLEAVTVLSVRGTYSASGRRVFASASSRPDAVAPMPSTTEAARSQV
jgi:uncharacterized BrkB/YihY/UPF0761 family membrane protein